MKRSPIPGSPCLPAGDCGADYELADEEVNSCGNLIAKWGGREMLEILTETRCSPLQNRFNLLEATK